MRYFVYILSNLNRTVLYVGYTKDIKKRVELHRNGKGAFFTKKYNVTDLVYFEVFSESNVARRREKQLKNWHKDWKWNLIREKNPDFKSIEL